MAMVMDIGVVEHDLPATAQFRGPIGFAFHKTVDYAAVQIGGARTVRQFQAGIANGRINAVNVECVPHDAVPDPVSAAGACLVAQKNNLGTIELDSGRA